MTSKRFQVCIRQLSSFVVARIQWHTTSAARFGAGKYSQYHQIRRQGLCGRTWHHRYECRSLQPTRNKRSLLDAEQKYTWNSFGATGPFAQFGEQTHNYAVTAGFGRGLNLNVFSGSLLRTGPLRNGLLPFAFASLSFEPATTMRVSANERHEHQTPPLGMR